MSPEEAFRELMGNHHSTQNSDLLNGIFLQKAGFLSKIGNGSVSTINKVLTRWPIIQRVSRHS